ncbi:CMGC/CDK protein kinase [Fasciolopsis buskii]|uniref:Cyclin-dependent kinase 20 n=1 Tax=Fasciolopsis buskii TaxID=27845 RepID=A0A8E0RTI1_9TREM|nr:CMGC/CDK protein kinase [Fasciolopsis buski]
MEQYDILGRIGEGAHGIVLKAKHVESGELVALKKVPLRKLVDGIPNTALREIKALQFIESSPYVVRLREVFPHGTGFVLVFDYMLTDLSEVIRNSDCPLTESHIKSYMIMLLSGVEVMHENGIMHRDLKPANLLISSTGLLKIADFGLARVFHEPTSKRLYSHQVATRWYRAPELLYGARIYTKSVDLWAVGCIFGELLNNSPLFPGENDIEQLWFVIRVLGTPKESDWPEIKDLPDYNKITFNACEPVPFEQVLSDAPPKAVDLVRQFLIYPPYERISATKALLHDYFTTEPLPTPTPELPRPNSHRSSRTRIMMHSQPNYEECLTVPLESIVASHQMLHVGASYAPSANRQSSTVAHLETRTVPNTSPSQVAVPLQGPKR